MADFQIGNKIKELRIKNGLTQEELANRSELSKGFISQLESDQNSPSIATLMDILECLGTNIGDFFKEESREKLVFVKDDYFTAENDDGKGNVTWLVPSCQKNQMEPILLELEEGGRSPEQDPHEGEEFGYILAGRVCLHLGETKIKVQKGESFYFKPFKKHFVENISSTKAKLIWVATPPSF